jgi:RNA polymerase sigma-70 factor (ECF subfamily)
MEDNELIYRCQSGEKIAFQELISKYHPYVFKFLVKLTENEYLAEDLTQDVFVKIIRNIDKFDIHGKAKFSTYTVTIAKNSFIDYLRKEKKYLLSQSFEDISSLEAFASGFEESLLDRVYVENIMERLENLTDEQKIVIKLKYLENLTLKEIGEMLELEPKTVKSRIHNAITKLRKMLEAKE